MRALLRTQGSHYGELPMFLSLDIAEFMPLSQTRKERKKSLKIQTRERDDLERPFRTAACFSGTRRFSKESTIGTSWAHGFCLWGGDVARPRQLLSS